MAEPCRAVEGLIHFAIRGRLLSFVPMIFWLLAPYYSEGMPGFGDEFC